MQCYTEHAMLSESTLTSTIDALERTRLNRFKASSVLHVSAYLEHPIIEMEMISVNSEMLTQAMLKMFRAFEWRTPLGTLEQMCVQKKKEKEMSGVYGMQVKSKTGNSVCTGIKIHHQQ